MHFFTFDDDYVRRLREGDRDAVEHYYRYFNHFLRLKLGGRVPAGDIDDIIGEVHFRVFRFLLSGKPIHDSSRFGAFVFRFNDNIVSERRRASHLTVEPDDTLPADVDVLRDLLRDETKSRVRRTLDSLPERDAKILTAVFLDERDRDDICQELGVDREYLRVLIYRAIEKFRDKHDH
jgi:RNA polymerase sigma-70 factor (ECF subfamily)